MSLDSEDTQPRVSFYCGDKRLEIIIDEDKFFKILDIINIKEKIDDFNIKKRRLEDLLHRLGISSNLKGYTYIKYSIYLTKEKNINKTRHIYNLVANHYNTSSNAVEHAISHAIKRGWHYAELSMIDKIFGYSIKDIPTNTQFIIMVSELI